MGHKLEQLRLGRAAARFSAIVLAIKITCTTAGASAASIGPLVTISIPDPLASCSALNLPADDNMEPYVAVNPLNTSNMVTLWMAHGTAGLGCATTTDGGLTWLRQPLPLPSPCSGAADPWVSFAPDGNAYALNPSFIAGYTVDKSSDGGLSWSQPTLVYPHDGSRFNDKASLTADPYDARYLYVAWAQFPKNLAGNNCQTIFARSADGGQTWTIQTIHYAASGDFNWGHQIVVLPDKTVVCAFCEGSFQPNHQAGLTLLRSSDQGQTWAAPVYGPTQLPLMYKNSNPPMALVSDPDTGCTVAARPMFDSIAVDRNSGRIYAVWSDARFSGNQINAIALSASSDGGVSWSVPIQVNQTPVSVPLPEQQAWNPSVAVAADGTVAVTYYDFRNNTTAPGCLTDYYLAYWRPGNGAFWYPANWSEARLTDSSFDLEQAGPDFFEACYLLGDYEGLASTGQGFAAVWTQPYAGTHNQIFFRKVSF